MRVESPLIGPGERTAVRVHVLNSGTIDAKNVTVVLADGSERSSTGIVMRHLGDMAPASLKSTTLSLPYTIYDSVRLSALTVAVFTRSNPIDAEDGVRRSSALREVPAPVVVRVLGEMTT